MSSLFQNSTCDSDSPRTVLRVSVKPFGLRFRRLRCDDWGIEETRRIIVRRFHFRFEFELMRCSE